MSYTANFRTVPIFIPGGRDHSTGSSLHGTTGMGRGEAGMGKAGTAEGDMGEAGTEGIQGMGREGRGAADTLGSTGAG